MILLHQKFYGLFKASNFGIRQVLCLCTRYHPCRMIDPAAESVQRFLALTLLPTIQTVLKANEKRFRDFEFNITFSTFTSSFQIPYPLCELNTPAAEWAEYELRVGRCHRHLEAKKEQIDKVLKSIKIFAE